MTVLLKETIKPNLVQTLEGQPAFVHCGPFANIAHGNNSLVADRVALKLADYVVTESGFGSDMGMEKFFDIVCRLGNLRPDAVVLVATVKALKHHAGDPDGGAEAIETGGANLARHLGDRARVRAQRGRRGQPLPGRHRRRDRARPHASRSSTAPTPPRSTTASARAAPGRRRSPRRSSPRPSEPSSFDFLYPLDAPIEEKIEAIAKRVYGADGIFLQPAARAKIKQFNKAGLDTLPICMAKTHLSLSHDPSLANAPTGFTVGVRDLRAYTGAGWIVALCGDMQTMPGSARRRPRSTSTSTRTARRLASSSWRRTTCNVTAVADARLIRRAADPARESGRSSAGTRTRSSARPTPTSPAPSCARRRLRRRRARRLVRGLARRGLRRHGALGLRQVDARAHADPPDRADGRPRSRSTARTSPRRAATSCAAAPPHVVDGLPALRPARAPPRDRQRRVRARDPGRAEGGAARARGEGPAARRARGRRRTSSPTSSPAACSSASASRARSPSTRR